MAFPANYTTQYKSKIGDGSGEYADKTGQRLDFVDARNSSNRVYFVAFLNGFSQSFSSSWNTEEVLGRMDSIATFKNTTRTISLGWEVVGSDRREAKENLQRSNQLVNLLYPSYDDRDNALAMARPPLIRLKYANLITSGVDPEEGLLGFLTSVNWNPVLEMGYIHTKDKIFPKVISISIEFTVIHERKLGYSNDNSLLADPTSNATPHSKNWPFSN
jgi:hypothetical protein